MREAIGRTICAAVDHVSAPSGHRRSVPWLLLRIAEHEGNTATDWVISADEEWLLQTYRECLQAIRLIGRVLRPGLISFWRVDRSGVREPQQHIAVAVSRLAPADKIATA
jgi:hypothetical protein